MDLRKLVAIWASYREAREAQGLCIMGLVSIITAIKDLDHILFYKLITYNCSKYLEPNSKLIQYMNEKKKNQNKKKKNLSEIL